MTKQANIQIATEMIYFEYFCKCVNSGATPEQAKEEMLTSKAQAEIEKRIKEII